MSEHEIDLFIYLPGCHAVKTKHDIKALAHFTDTVSSNESSRRVRFFPPRLLARRFNDRLKGSTIV